MFKIHYEIFHAYTTIYQVYKLQRSLSQPAEEGEYYPQSQNSQVHNPSHIYPPLSSGNWHFASMSLAFLNGLIA